MRPADILALIARGGECDGAALRAVVGFLAPLVANGGISAAEARLLLRHLPRYWPDGGGEILRQRFVLGEILGIGTVATVIAARDLRREEARDPSAAVALKLLNPAFIMDGHARGALFGEARLAARLDHPNILRVLDWDADGALPFIVMERLAGQPISRFARETAGRGIGWAAAVPLGRQIAAALAHAHDNLVAHGDLKPDNLHLTPSGEVVVLDFGAARGLGPGGPVAAFAGFTARWATAELAQGALPEPADDLHAMASILYRLANGGLEGPPQRLPGMSRGSWEMLRLALEPHRASQPPSAQAFLERVLG
jgi:serine/threonine protein kinase